MGKVSITELVQRSPKPLTQKELEKAIASATLPEDGLDLKLLEKPFYIVGFDRGYTHSKAVLVKAGSNHILMPFSYIVEHRELLNISEAPEKILKYLKSVATPGVSEVYCVECLLHQMYDWAAPFREI